MGDSLRKRILYRSNRPMILKLFIGKKKTCNIVILYQIYWRMGRAEAPGSSCLNITVDCSEVTAREQSTDSFLALYTNDTNINGD